MASYLYGNRIGKGDGYFGLPHLASQEMGQAYLEIVAEESSKTITKMMAGQDVARECQNQFYKMMIFNTHLGPLSALIPLVYKALEPFGVWHKMDRFVMARMFNEDRKNRR